MTVRVVALLIWLLAPLATKAASDLSSFAFRQHPGAQVPMDAPLRDETGHSVRLRSLLSERPAILVLGYLHCPNLCGIVRNDVLHAVAQSGLRPDQYSLIVLSIDPAENSADAAAAKREDVARYPLPGADTGWHYLTGQADALQQITDAVGFRYQYDARLRQFLHPAGMVFLNAAGRVSGYLLGVGYSPGDLALGVTRASRDGFERATAPVLLLCFHFDPATGRYTLAINKVLEIACGLTVLTLAGLIGLALRHERQR